MNPRLLAHWALRVSLLAQRVPNKPQNQPRWGSGQKQEVAWQTGDRKDKSGDPEERFVLLGTYVLSLCQSTVITEDCPALIGSALWDG